MKNERQLHLPKLLHILCMSFTHVLSVISVTGHAELKCRVHRDKIIELSTVSMSHPCSGLSVYSYQ